MTHARAYLLEDQEREERLAGRIRELEAQLAKVRSDRDTMIRVHDEVEADRDALRSRVAELETAANEECAVLEHVARATGTDPSVVTSHASWVRAQAQMPAARDLADAANLVALRHRVASARAGFEAIRDACEIAEHEASPITIMRNAISLARGRALRELRVLADPANTPEEGPASKESTPACSECGRTEVTLYTQAKVLRCGGCIAARPTPTGRSPR